MCILLRNDNSYSYIHVIVCIDISLLLTFWFLYSETILDKVQSSDKFQVDEFHCLTNILAGRIAAIHPVTTVGPRYEEQLMSDGGAYSPFRSILLVLAHDFIIICVYGPTGSEGTSTERRGRCVAHHFCAVWCEGSAVSLGLRPASQRSTTELPPARLVIHISVGTHAPPPPSHSHRPSSKKMLFPDFSREGEERLYSCPAPTSPGHPSPPYKNRSASFFASYDHNLM